MDPLLLSVRESCPVIGVSRSRMFELIARGELESVKIGRRRLVPREAIDTYIERLRAEQLATPRA